MKKTILQNNFIIASCNPGYNFINIGGWAIGITVSILVSLWIHDESKQSNQNYNHVTQLTQDDWFIGRKEIGRQSNPILLSTKLRNVHKDSHVHTALSSQGINFTATKVNKKFTQPGRFMLADTGTYFTMSLLIQGNALSLRQR